MNRIDLSGVYGAATVAVTHDGQTASATGNFSAPDGISAVSVYAMHSVQARPCEPVSITSESDAWNGSRFGAGYSPCALTNQTIVKGVDGDRVQISDMDFFRSYAPGIYTGGTIEFRRVVDGTMVRVGSARMAEVAFPLADRMPDNTAKAASGTSYRFTFASWNRANAPYWFAVAAVTSDGATGPLSDWVEYRPTSVTEVTSVSNPQVTTAMQSGTEAALAAPTGVACAAYVKNETAYPGVAEITWNAVSGATGYVVRIGYTDPATWPDNDGEVRLADLDGEMPVVGDMAIYRKEITSFSPDMICARVYGDYGTHGGLTPAPIGNGRFGGANDSLGWELLEWDGDKPSPELGRHYLRRYAKQGSNPVESYYWSGGSGQTFYHNKKAGEVLALDVWIRASETIPMEFTSGQPGEPVQTFTVGPEWQRYELRSDYATAPGGTQAYKWSLKAGDATGDLIVDYAQLRVYLTGSDYGAVQPYMQGSLVPGQKWRDHVLIKSRPQSYSMASAINPSGEGYKGWTCATHMDICRAHGLVPWVQLEWALPKEDWLLWAEWVATNYPDFDRIMLEFGNENWNTLSSFWTVPGMTDQVTGTAYGNGAVYGMISRMIFGWLQESPYWPQLKDRIELVIGGWNGNSFGEAAWRQCPEARYVTIANYNGGWDTGTYLPDETANSFSGILRFRGGIYSLTGRETALATAAADLGKTVGVDVFHDIYEAGPGYQLNGLNNVAVTAAQAIVQECVQKSRAAALAQLDAICTCWQRGWLSNYFTLGEGDYWKSHNPLGEEHLSYAVGRVISESLGIFRAHEIYPLQMAQDNGVDEVVIYAFESLEMSGKWIYVVLNRALDRTVLDPSDPEYDATDAGIRPVTIHTMHDTAVGCRVFLGGIGNMREHNRYTPGKRLTEAGGYTSDPLCVSFDLDWHEVAAPERIGTLTIDDTFGAEAGGLRGGNFVIIEFTGAA